MRKGSVPVVLFGLLLCGASLSGAQAGTAPGPDGAAVKGGAQAKLPEYEVVSIKQNKSVNESSRWGTGADGFSAENAWLALLISNAYGIRTDLISGVPHWADAARFDVSAKVAGEDLPRWKQLDNDQQAAMLRPVLAERFGLKVHTETKVLPVYNLVLAKGGVKMKTAPPDPPTPGLKPGEIPPGHGSWMSNTGDIKGTDITSANIADLLSGKLQRTVIDKTGLTARYDFEVKFSEEQGPADNGAEAGASLYTALQEQLGLKLEPAKGPVEVLVVDHAAMPTEN